MTQFISAISLVIPDYDAAIDFYVGVLNFTLKSDSVLPDGKRWVTVSPPGAKECALLLALAIGDEQTSRIGNQTGGRVFLFLNTDDFERDYAAMKQKGVEFLQPPRHESYGRVVVFADPFGNKWDLIEPA
ncbi:MAG: VOC family protein [Devosiaceae bacterium]|nr:VOC family protein [Devosiaceae bacterium]